MEFIRNSLSRPRKRKNKNVSVDEKTIYPPVNGDDDVTKSPEKKRKTKRTRQQPECEFHNEPSTSSGRSRVKKCTIDDTADQEFPKNSHLLLQTSNDGILVANRESQKNVDNTKHSTKSRKHKKRSSQDDSVQESRTTDDAIIAEQIFPEYTCELSPNSTDTNDFSEESQREKRKKRKKNKHSKKRSKKKAKTQELTTEEIIAKKAFRKYYRHSWKKSQGGTRDGQNEEFQKYITKSKTKKRLKKCFDETNGNVEMCTSMMRQINENINVQIETIFPSDIVEKLTAISTTEVHENEQYGQDNIPLELEQQIYNQMLLLFGEECGENNQALSNNSNNDSLSDNEVDTLNHNDDSTVNSSPTTNDSISQILHLKCSDDIVDEGYTMPGTNSSSEANIFNKNNPASINNVTMVNVHSVKTNKDNDFKETGTKTETNKRENKYGFRFEIKVSIDKNKIIKMLDKDNHVYKHKIINDLAVIFMNGFTADGDSLFILSESTAFEELIISLIDMFNKTKYNMAYLSGCLVSVFCKIAEKSFFLPNQMQSNFIMFINTIKNYIKKLDSVMWSNWLSHDIFFNWICFVAYIFIPEDNDITTSIKTKWPIEMAMKYYKKIEQNQYVFIHNTKLFKNESLAFKGSDDTLVAKPESHQEKDQLTTNIKQIKLEPKESNTIEDSSIDTKISLKQGKHKKNIINRYYFETSQIERVKVEENQCDTNLVSQIKQEPIEIEIDNSSVETKHQTYCEYEINMSRIPQITVRSEFNLSNSFRKKNICNKSDHPQSQSSDIGLMPTNSNTNEVINNNLIRNTDTQSVDNNNPNKNYSPDIANNTVSLGIDSIRNGFAEITKNNVPNPNVILQQETAISEVNNTKISNVTLGHNMSSSVDNVHANYSIGNANFTNTQHTAFSAQTPITQNKETVFNVGNNTDTFSTPKVATTKPDYMHANNSNFTGNASNYNTQCTTLSSTPIATTNPNYFYANNSHITENAVPNTQRTTFNAPEIPTTNPNYLYANNGNITGNAVSNTQRTTLNAPTIIATSHPNYFYANISNITENAVSNTQRTTFNAPAIPTTDPNYLYANNSNITGNAVPKTQHTTFNAPKIIATNNPNYFYANNSNITENAVKNTQRTTFNAPTIATTNPNSFYTNNSNIIENVVSNTQRTTFNTPTIPITDPNYLYANNGNITGNAVPNTQRTTFNTPEIPTTDPNYLSANNGNITGNAVPNTQRTTFNTPTIIATTNPNYLYTNNSNITGNAVPNTQRTTFNTPTIIATTNPNYLYTNNSNITENAVKNTQRTTFNAPTIATTNPNYLYANNSNIIGNVVSNTQRTTFNTPTIIATTNPNYLYANNSNITENAVKNTQRTTFNASIIPTTNPNSFYTNNSNITGNAVSNTQRTTFNAPIIATTNPNYFYANNSNITGNAVSNTQRTTFNVPTIATINPNSSYANNSNITGNPVPNTQRTTFNVPTIATINPNSSYANNSNITGNPVPNTQRTTFNVPTIATINPNSSYANNSNITGNPVPNTQRTTFNVPTIATINPNSSYANNSNITGNPVPNTQRTTFNAPTIATINPNSSYANNSNITGNPVPNTQRTTFNVPTIVTINPNYLYANNSNITGNAVSNTQCTTFNTSTIATTNPNYLYTNNSNITGNAESNTQRTTFNTPTIATSNPDYLCANNSNITRNAVSKAKRPIKPKVSTKKKNKPKRVTNIPQNNIQTNHTMPINPITNPTNIHQFPSVYYGSSCNNFAQYDNTNNQPVYYHNYQYQMPHYMQTQPTPNAAGYQNNFSPRIGTMDATQPSAQNNSNHNESLQHLNQMSVMWTPYAGTNSTNNSRLPNNNNNNGYQSHMDNSYLANKWY